MSRKHRGLIPFGTCLGSAEVALAGALMNAQRFLEHSEAFALCSPGAPERFRGVELADIESDAFLGFLGRALRWLKRAALAHGAPATFVTEAQAFNTALTDAQMLRDLAEHADAYQAGEGHRPNESFVIWPNTPGSKSRPLTPGSFFVFGTAPVRVTVHGPDGPKVSVLIEGRLDVRRAAEVISKMLEVVEGEIEADKARHAQNGGS